MKTALIIDDEKLARENIKRHLQQFKEIAVVGECANGFEGYKAIYEHQPSIVFLDIQMPKINGFEMLELVENVPQVVFITAFDKYAIKAFETGAVDYLLKPFSKDRFQQAMEKILSVETNHQISSVESFTADMPERQNRIVVKEKNEIRIVPVETIEYIEAFDDYVKIKTKEKRHVKKVTMKFLEDSLPKQQFVRVHRSYIINVNELTKIEPYQKNNYVAILKNEDRIPISRSGYKLLQTILGL